jgi:GMP synthase (glutamine-hydrolysing)
MAWHYKGKVAKCDHREYGFAQVQMRTTGKLSVDVDALFEGLGDEMQVNDKVSTRSPSSTFVI